MIKNNLFTKISGLGFFYRWHPEVALRYLPLVTEINKMGERIKVLEVGSGGLGIVPYFKKPVIGVDVEFKPPIHPLLTQVRASATKLPFKNSSFDVVLSIDMLEHLFSSDRKKAIEEMIRVAKKKVLIAVPCGKEAYQQDLKLNAYFQKKFGTTYHFLEEQISIGLPEKEEIVDTIHTGAKKINKSVKIVIMGNESIILRNFLMKGWMTNNIFIEIFFRKILLFAIPLIRNINSEPTYRKLFFVDIIYENRN